MELREQLRYLGERGDELSRRMLDELVRMDAEIVALRNEGVIRKVGFQNTSSPSRHGGVETVWEGAE